MHICSRSRTLCIALNTSFSLIEPHTFRTIYFIFSRWLDAVDTSVPWLIPTRRRQEMIDQGNELIVGIGLSIHQSGKRRSVVWRAAFEKLPGQPYSCCYIREPVATELSHKRSNIKFCRKSVYTVPFRKASRICGAMILPPKIPHLTLRIQKC